MQKEIASAEDTSDKKLSPPDLDQLCARLCKTQNYAKRTGTRMCIFAASLQISRAPKARQQNWGIFEVRTENTEFTEFTHARQKLHQTHRLTNCSFFMHFHSNHLGYASAETAYVENAWVFDLKMLNSVKCDPKI